MVFISESQPLKDRVAVLDTRDDGWWSWYRFEHDLENKIHYLSDDLEEGVPEDW